MNLFEWGESPCLGRRAMWPLRVVAALVCTIILGTGSVAWSQFLTLDRQGPRSFATADFGLSLVDDGEFDGIFVRSDFYGQYAFEYAGAYAEVAVSSYHGDHSVPGGAALSIVPEFDGAVAVGNAELGGFGQYHGDIFGIVGRLGVTLPTADDPEEGSVVNRTALAGRQTDAVQGLTDYVAVRFSASPTVDLGLFFARIDLGFDAAFYVGDNDFAEDTRTFLHANAGVGVDLTFVSVTLEFPTLIETSDSELPSDHLAALGITGGIGPVDVYAGYALPLDDERRGDLHIVQLGVSLDFGRL